MDKKQRIQNELARFRGQVSKRLYTEVEAADYLNIAVATLRRWRWSGHGPPFVKIGRCVRYEPADLDAHIQANKRRSTSEGQVSP